MAVKQIQLRGISRTPSDRMTRDGGLAESLNMQLDGEELAPMRLPDDVTSELLANYPAYAAGDKVVYIHHGNGYTNYIVEVQGGVFALFEGGATAQTLMNNDSVERATTMGNALIIRYASGTVNNFIYKDGTPMRGMWYDAQCEYCGCYLGPAPSMEMLIENWNRRAKE